MKKNMFYTAAVLLAGAVMAACSGSEDMTSDNAAEPQTPAQQGVVELSGTIGGKGNLTRTISETGAGSWAVGDQFAIYYQTSSGHSTAVATINSVNENGAANFKVSLYYPKTGESNVTLIYPASAHNGTGGIKAAVLAEQDGTLAGINNNGLDIETGTTGLNVEEQAGKYSKATLNSDVQMQPQVCLYTLNLKKDAETDLSATKLEISDGTNSYTVTPTGGTATNSFTVALLPASDASFTFAATTTESGRVYTKQAVTLATCTSANVGHVFDKDGNVYEVSNGPGVIYGANFSNKTLESGKFYTSNLTLEASAGAGITPVAMIAYVGAAGSADSSTGEGSGSFRGLAMAMSDVNNTYYAWAPEGQGYQEECSGVYQNSTFTNHRDCADMKGIDNTRILANHTCSASHSHPAAEAAKNYSVEGFTPSDLGCSNWFLPSSGQWFKFFEACGVNLSSWTAQGFSPGGASDYTKVVTNTMNNAGANFPASYGYCMMWSSSQSSEDSVMSVGFYTSVGVGVYIVNKNAGNMVRPFLAF